ncbi:MAG TPA: LAGLIDADG family homing endonuclease [Kofleriaceae bacterium]|nr:LAGLIDADG family homing endonuclease [Kofleriaceae bacterium]
MSTTRSKVAVIRVRPDHILEDIDRLHDLAGVEHAFDKSAQTILKDNISWHFPFPGANTTPWQLEGTIRSLRARGFHDLVCVQNKTVVTDAFKGEDLNGYVPIFKRYDIPVRYNFKPEDMTWSIYRPKAKMLVLDKIFPEGIQIPDAFHGTNIVHLPTSKCVSGDTRVMLGDGSVLTIKELVDRQLARASFVQLDSDGTVHADGQASVFAMAPDGSVRAMQATHFARTRANGRKVFELRLKSGRTLTATEDHPVFTPTGWVAVGKLAPRDRVGIARRTRLAGSAQPLPRTHAAGTWTPRSARPGRTYSAALAEQFITEYAQGSTVTAIAAKANVRWQKVQHVLKRHGVPLRRNVVQVSVPSETSPAFWRWLGYITAEGCAENLEQGAGKIWWTNTDPELRAEFIELTNTLFGVEARVRTDAKISIYSRDLVRFLSELGLPIPLNSGNKHVPAALFRGTDEEIAAYLSGYLDGDGTVSAKQADLSAVTKSKQLALDLVLLFGRLGVAAFLKEVYITPPNWSTKQTYYRVAVAGAAVTRLHEVLSLRHREKSRRLQMHVERLQGSKQPSNWDTVPVDPDRFRALRTRLGFTQQSTGLAGSVNNIENGYTNPTGRILRSFIDLFDRAPHDDHTRAELDAIKVLANDDLAWDHVESIIEVPSDIDLYDITVPEAGSFIANGIVAHNCHIYTTTTGAMKNAFGGLLNTKRHYTHSWIHETLVDLLAIQKEIHAGLFAVMDGTTAGDGPGPRTMRPVIKDVMLASEDQVAIDAVAASMMGFDPMSLPYIKLADEAGLGNGRREHIEVAGDTQIADERWGFSVGDNGASMVGDVMWFGPLKRFQKLFFHTPLVNLFVLGSEAYHDYYRWPLRDRRVFEQWRETTHWGQLFDYYQSHGTLAPSDVATPQAG